MLVILILIFSLFDNSFVDSAKILVISPAPLISHQAVFRPLIQELVNRGHEVTVISTDPVYPQGATPKSLSEIIIHELSYKLWEHTSKTLAKCDESNLTKMKVAFHSITEIGIAQLKDKSVVRLFKDPTIKFDLLVVASVAPIALIYSHIFKAPIILMSTFGALPGNMKTIGSESHPLLYPTHYHKKIYNLTVWEKIYEMYIDVLYNNVHEEEELVAERILKSHFGSDVPSLKELKDKVHMLFLKLHPIWLHNQAVPSTVSYTWGIHKPSEKTLPKELQSYLDSSKNGVIYISFGSVFKTSGIPLETLKIFLTAFSRLPYNILWKWDADDLPGKLQNIKISKWLPQYDVLRHPNLKLFITHGGLQSTDEAIHAGVPIIGIPQFSDQEYNTEKYSFFKIGIKLDFKSLTIDSFENAIKTILSDYNSYKENIIQLRTQMYDQPKPALEHVMWRMEYMLRHGGVQHLRAPAANMSWVQYYELELVLIVLTAVIAVGTVLLLTLHIAYSYLLSILRHINIKIKKNIYLFRKNP